MNSLDMPEMAAELMALFLFPVTRRYREQDVILLREGMMNSGGG